MDDQAVRLLGVRSRTLGLAVSDGEVGGTRVGSTGASVVLDRAAPLESGTSVHKGVTVDRERPITGRALNSWGSTAKGARELLDVGSGSGTRLVSLGNGSLDLGSRDIRDQEVLGDDASNSVGGDIARVSGASVVIFLGTSCQLFNPFCRTKLFTQIIYLPGREQRFQC